MVSGSFDLLALWFLFSWFLVLLDLRVSVSLLWFSFFSGPCGSLVRMVISFSFSHGFRGSVVLVIIAFSLFSFL